MTMLRVSSYRRLFEEEQWARSGGSSMQCAEEYRSPARGAAGHKCECEQLDFVAAKAINKEGLSRFTQDRTVLAALNNRLATLIELARCFEEENESLETQILALEDRLSSQQASSTSTAIVVPDYSLDAVVERLRKEKEEILCVTEELRSELECLQQEHQKAVQQRTLVQEQREDVAMDVDAVTAECLALREQVCIYEEQLANMEAQHATTVETLAEPAEGAEGAMTAVEFCSPDITPALQIKEYYCQLAESLQYECGMSSAVVAVGNGQQGELASGSRGTDVSKITDVNELKKQIGELEKELMELEKCNEELEDEGEMKKAEYLEQIEELECRIEEMGYKQEDLDIQMKQQCEEYQDLLSEKMARDIEIAAYRGLVEEEDERLCYL
ncbi:peripherin [Osmerus mordax]|uniref:peripherin n=1 Tax=Osmerus mordax TaxID=8014 RepID=UPI00350F133D